MDSREPQKPLFSYKPAAADATCRREMRLDKAGKPVICKANAYVNVAGHDVCRRHFEDMKLAVEIRLAAERKAAAAAKQQAA